MQMVTTVVALVAGIALGYIAARRSETDTFEKLQSTRYQAWSLLNRHHAFLANHDGVDDAELSVDEVDDECKVCLGSDRRLLRDWKAGLDFGSMSR